MQHIASTILNFFTPLLRLQICTVRLLRHGTERSGFSLRAFRRVSGRFPVYLEQREKDLDKDRVLPIIERALCGRYRTAKRCIDLERVKTKLQYLIEDAEEDYSLVDAVIASLNLTENMNLALDYRMSGMSYPAIAKMMSKATATVYEYLVKVRQRYFAVYGG